MMMENALHALDIVAASWQITFGFIALCVAILITRVNRRTLSQNITHDRITADKELELARLKYMHGQIDGRALSDKSGSKGDDHS